MGVIEVVQWTEGMLDRIDRERTYSRRELIVEMKKLKAGLSEGTYHWAIGQLIHEGDLVRLGYDSYALSSGLPRDEYRPAYSDEARDLIDLISQRYPHVQFTVFETVLMNDFLNHLIAQNTVFVQVEKESSVYVFRFLQDCGYRNVMYKPSRKELDLYWSRDCIIVTDLISEAPLRLDEPHSIMLEKLIVDMSADRLISGTYSKAEFSDVVKQAQSRYRLDKAKMLRYARRRNQQAVFKEYLDGDMKTFTHF